MEVLYHSAHRIIFSDENPATRIKSPVSYILYRERILNWIYNNQISHRIRLVHTSPGFVVNLSPLSRVI